MHSLLRKKIAAQLSSSLSSSSPYLPWYRRLITRFRKPSSDNSFLTSALEASPDAFFLHDLVRDHTGRVIDLRFHYFNPSAERLTGHRRDDLAGTLVSSIFPDVHHPDYMRVFETNQSVVVERSGISCNQTPCLLRLHLTPLPDSLLVNCRDVTAERSLARTEAFNRSYVTSTTASILVIDPDGTITSLNPAAEYMLGYDQEDLVGRNITALHDPIELVERARQLSNFFNLPIEPDASVLFARPLRGLAEDGEWIWICRNGVRLPVQLTINPVHDDSGALLAFLATSVDLTDRKQTDQYIYHIAHHDPLTGLAGRSLLRDHIYLAVERSLSTQSLFSVLMVDLDNFKRINDSLGHENGDSVLREVAFRLRETVRKSDTVARFGSDEFVILLNGIATRAEAEAVAHKITHAFLAPIYIGTQQIVLTAGIGLAMYPESTTPDELLQHADLALHHGKATGRSALSVFTPELGKMLHDRLRLESALRLALARDEFFLVYQPQVSLETHRLIGVEALLRWRNPDFGLVMPDTFIPIAEETGLIVSIGAWCLETACQQMAILQHNLGRRISVAVNLSPSQVHEEHFLETVERALTLSGLPPSCLEVEITERLLMRDSEEALHIIERVQALGVTVAIDDFGTGFSNMSYITRFKVDRLKIDRSFVSRCLTDANSFAVTTAIIALAHSLRIEVVAEGVETTDQADMLRTLACDSAQGYLYARPLTLPDLTEFAFTEHQPGLHPTHILTTPPPTPTPAPTHNLSS